ncbi:CPBP family intramembrane glutamic endopeptidase [Aquimarina litoralis]|uniref:CPBP family intramembrane glutamic endopeptidase n=1 Tax=Aquimarina litoralis TaxID=584605 RepID=UPI001C596BFB|nr:CPBP family intramembrane glutamic endopeptidase [Aquimarina litoralis]MBW1297625.1 CPBP family intramembrane metalloprotease [Aquimarina litoralis]
MYIEQALNGKNEWWKYLIGLVLTFIGWQVIGVIPLIGVAFTKIESLKEFEVAAENNFADIGIDKNLFLILVILSFAMGLVALLFAVKNLHRQSIKSLTTSRNKVDWNRIFFCFFLLVGINVVLFAISYFTESEIYTWNFKLVPFLILFLISVLLLPLQTSFEEYLFRGYLMQGLGVLSKTKWFPLLFTSVTFGLLHGLNPEVAKLGNIMMVFYIGTGLLLGVMTLMDDGMELALGFHAANNIIAAILITTDWSAFQTDALFIDTSEPSAGLDIILPIAIQYPLIILILAKKYKWSGWKDKLFGKVEPAIQLEE